MSKSPESDRKRRLELSSPADAMARDLDRERRIQSDRHRIADHELAADRELRNRLASLRPPPLPPALRRHVMEHAVDQRSSTAWLALAAAVVMSLLAVVAMQTFDDGSQTAASPVTADDWAQLHLALNTLDASGRRVAQVTEREVRSHLNPAEIQIAPFPDSGAVQSWLPPSLQSIR